MMRQISYLAKLRQSLNNKQQKLENISQSSDKEGKSESPYDPSPPHLDEGQICDENLAESDFDRIDDVLIDARMVSPERPKSPSYMPLQRNESRLIHLYPGVGADPICFDLRPFSLDVDRLPFYEAVSYTWGDATDSTPVSCQGYLITVPGTIKSLLQCFRLRDTTRLLWVDAVCINQLDLSEKSVQVFMMDKIYEQANRVLVHLGEADNESNEVMDSIFERKVSKTSMRDSILRFFQSRPWFSRIWVLQEVALAECALVICGSKCVPWACFRAWWTRNVIFIQDASLHPPALSLNFSKRPSILQQLHDTRRSQATHPSDKVYGLLGLLSPEDKIFISPDYGKSLKEVYSDLATSIILKSESQSSLRILSAAGYRDDQIHVPYSWVPDWRIIPSLTPLGLGNLFSEPFDAGGTGACGTYVGGEGCIFLSCLGIGLDTIEETGAILNLSNSRDDVARIITEWTQLASRTIVARKRNRPKFTYYYGPNAEMVGLLNPGNFQFLDTIHAQPSPTLDLISEGRRSIEGSRILFTQDELKFSIGRRFVLTKKDFIGLVPPQAKPGDIVAILLGAPVPHVLRKLPNGHFKLVGECYIHGVMAGEALGHLKIEGHRCRPCAKSKSNASLKRFIIE